MLWKSFDGWNKAPNWPHAGFYRVNDLKGVVDLLRGGIFALVSRRRRLVLPFRLRRLFLRLGIVLGALGVLLLNSFFHGRFNLRMEKADLEYDEVDEVDLGASPPPPPSPPSPRGHKRVADEPVVNSAGVKTPEWLKAFIYDEFPCDNDASADGLNRDWHGFTFVNPPYSESQAWIEKAALEASKGNFSVLLVPAVFNSLYWREIVYPNATSIGIFKCPIKFEGHKKQVVTQMSLVSFVADAGNDGDPVVTLLEPDQWADHYYARKRNKTRFQTRR